MGSTDISSSTFASWARQLIKLITTLRALGAQADFDLPRIAVIGNQSAGKSSLVEAISGISVPRAHGTCTRCPMECRLMNSDRHWQCQVLLRRETDENGQRIPVKEEPFGPLIRDKSQLEEMIRRAQLAILNPGRAAESFVNFNTKSLPHGQKPTGSPKQLAFSSNVVCLDLSGPDLPDLSFIDLPGIISTVDKGEDKENINAVRNMVQEHIQGNTLILLTITMRDDMNNQGAAHLAQLADPTGSRTIGVLTKPDLIQEGEEDAWLKILEGLSHSLKHGYFITKHPSPKELEKQVTHDQAREREAKFFETTPPWSLKSHLRSRMGTPNLTKELSNLLGALISQSLPTLRDNATESLNAVTSSLASLPPPPSDNPVLELLRMVNDFASDFKSLVQGAEGYERLLQQCRPAHQQLKWHILDTAPNFRPFKTAAADNEDFHFEIDKDDALDASRKRKRTSVTQPVYLEDIKAHIQSSLTRQLPFNVPFSVKVSFIERCFEDWEKHCLQCFDAIHRATEVELSGLAQKYFGSVGGVSLIADVRMHCDDLIRKYHTEALKMIRFLLKMEDPPFTINDHYFSACRDKYLAEFKAAQKPPLATADPAAVQTALAHLALIGYNVTADDLGKLRKEDKYEEELIVMAETSAYFRVAYKRVIDNIPRAIDHAFMRAVAQDLHAALTVGLSLTAENSNEQAAFYLAEDLQTKADRKHLTQKKERLDAVLRELSRFEHTVSPAAKTSSHSTHPAQVDPFPAIPSVSSARQSDEESSVTATSITPPPFPANPTAPPRHQAAVAAPSGPPSVPQGASVLSFGGQHAPQMTKAAPSVQQGSAPVAVNNSSSAARPSMFAAQFQDLHNAATSNAVSKLFSLPPQTPAGSLSAQPVASSSNATSNQAAPTAFSFGTPRPSHSQPQPAADPAPSNTAQPPATKFAGFGQPSSQPKGDPTSIFGAPPPAGGGFGQPLQAQGGSRSLFGTPTPTVSAFGGFGQPRQAGEPANPTAQNTKKSR